MPKAGKVTVGLAESNGGLLRGLSLALVSPVGLLPSNSNQLWFFLRSTCECGTTVTTNHPLADERRVCR